MHIHDATSVAIVTLVFWIEPDQYSSARPDRGEGTCGTFRDGGVGEGVWSPS